MWTFQADCSASSHCKWEHGVCFDVSEKAACHNIFSSKACQQFPQCSLTIRFSICASLIIYRPAWHEQYHTCYNTAAGMNCNIRPTDFCESDDKCVFNKDAHRCLSKGTLSE